MPRRSRPDRASERLPTLQFHKAAKEEEEKEEEGEEEEEEEEEEEQEEKQEEEDEEQKEAEREKNLSETLNGRMKERRRNFFSASCVGRSNTGWRRTNNTGETKRASQASPIERRREGRGGQ